MIQLHEVSQLVLIEYSVCRGELIAMSGLEYRGDCKTDFSDCGALTFPCVYILEILLHKKRETYVNIEYSNENMHSNCSRNKSNLVTISSRLSRSQCRPSFIGATVLNKP